MINKTFYGFVGVLCLFLLVFTTYLWLVEPRNSAFCVVDSEGKSSCDVVQSSQYSRIFGLRVVDFGVISFLLLFVSFIFLWIRFEDKKALLVFRSLCYIGAIFAVYFIILQTFFIKAWCATCLVIDLTMIFVALIVFIFSLNENLVR